MRAVAESLGNPPIFHCQQLINDSRFFEYSSASLTLHLIRLPTGIVQGTECVDNSVPEGVDGQLWDPQEVFPTQVTLFILVQTKEPVNMSTTVLKG